MIFDNIQVFLNLFFFLSGAMYDRGISFTWSYA